MRTAVLVGLFVMATPAAAQPSGGMPGFPFALSAGRHAVSAPLRRAAFGCASSHGYPRGFCSPARNADAVARSAAARVADRNHGQKTTSRGTNSPGRGIVPWGIDRRLGRWAGRNRVPPLVKLKGSAPSPGTPVCRRSGASRASALEFCTTAGH